MRLLKDDLQRLMQKKGLSRGLESAGVAKEAQKILERVLPATVLSEVKVESYSEGLLKLTVATGSPLSVASMYKQEILNALKRELGRAKIERVVITSRQDY